jgi:AcrR family transcriptional regulator
VKLNNQLVNKRRGGSAPQRRVRARRAEAPRTAAGRRRGPSTDASREVIFAAAAREFAARGFAGASVDRIAAAARFNKAMIYYHFGSKAALYREILRDMFNAVGAAVSAAAASDAAPADKIRQFVVACATEAVARPHFPPIWVRGVAEGGAHLDDETLTAMARIVRTVGAIVDEGVRAGAFTPISTLIVHAGIIAPLLLYYASAGIRRRLERLNVTGIAPGFTQIGRDQIVAHIQRTTVALLEGRIA